MYGELGRHGKPGAWPAPAAQRAAAPVGCRRDVDPARGGPAAVRGRAPRGCLTIPVVRPEGRASRRPVRAIARRRSARVAESRGRFGNAASVRAGHREAGGNRQTPPGGGGRGLVRPWGRPGHGREAACRTTAGAGDGRPHGLGCAAHPADRTAAVGEGDGPLDGAGNRAADDGRTRPHGHTARRDGPCVAGCRRTERAPAARRLRRTAARGDHGRARDRRLGRGRRPRHRLVRHAAMRRRLAEWDRAWAATEPAWTGRGV
ncbi:hypothetical protein SVIRM249S_00368 [Streptomyces viridochromogenes]